MLGRAVCATGIRQMMTTTRTSGSIAAVSSVRSYAAQPSAPASKKATGNEVVAPEGKLLFNMASPGESYFSNAVFEMVVLPGVNGMFGVLSNLIPTIAELKPGVISAYESKDGAAKKFFISGGFAVTKGQNLDVSVMEATPIDTINADAARNGLADATAAVAAAQSDKDKAEAQIKLDFFMALVDAVDGKV